MRRNFRFMDRLAEGADMLEEPFPGQPVVELTGDGRVLIENHRGVKEYSSERIGIKVKYGLIIVCGWNMELIRMSKDQMIITGRIDGISLVRRTQK